MVLDGLEKLKLVTELGKGLFEGKNILNLKGNHFFFVIQEVNVQLLNFPEIERV